jgi:hypothetical protein
MAFRKLTDSQSPTNSELLSQSHREIPHKHPSPPSRSHLTTATINSSHHLQSQSQNTQLRALNCSLRQNSKHHHQPITWLHTSPQTTTPRRRAVLCLSCSLLHNPATIRQRITARRRKAHCPCSASIYLSPPASMDPTRGHPSRCCPVRPLPAQPCRR